MRLFAALLLTVWLPAADLDALFDRAAYDPSALVPLVEAVAQNLPRMEADAAIKTADRLRPYTQQLYFGAETVPHMDRLGLIHYTVQSGDNFGAIAKEFGLATGHVQLLNPFVEPRSLQVGQKLKVLDARKRGLRAYVWRSKFRILLMQPLPSQKGLALVATYKVGIGTADRQTPVGVTHIDNKVKDPEWTNPDTGEVFAPSDPGNVLGGYWISLADGPDNIFDGIGLHGYTGAASSSWLERPGSRGCLRMQQDDIAQFYDIATIGMPIAIME